MTFGAIAGIIALVFMVGIYAGVEPDKKDMSKGMNMDNLTKKSRRTEAPAPAPAPAPAAAPAEAPKTDTPAAAPAAGGEAPKAEAPAAPAEEKK